MNSVQRDDFEPAAYIQKYDSFIRDPAAMNTFLFLVGHRLPSNHRSVTVDVFQFSGQVVCAHVDASI